MYDHDPDEEEAIIREIISNIQPSGSKTDGELLKIFNTRNSPATILITNSSEYSPQRDAKMLATLLSTTLDEKTLKYLSEILVAEYLAPYLNQIEPRSKPRKRDRPEDVQD